MSALDHSQRLLDFMSYVALISHRFTHDYIHKLIEVKAPRSLNRELNAFLELYSSYQPDYDYHDYKNQVTFSLFAENFEQKVQALEAKVADAVNNEQEEEIEKKT
jgi:hypothetical protein